MPFSMPPNNTPYKPFQLGKHFLNFLLWMPFPCQNWSPRVKLSSDNVKMFPTRRTCCSDTSRVTVKKAKGFPHLRIGVPRLLTNTFEKILPPRPDVAQLGLDVDESQVVERDR